MRQQRNLHFPDPQIISETKIGAPISFAPLERVHNVGESSISVPNDFGNENR